LQKIRLQSGTLPIYESWGWGRIPPGAPLSISRGIVTGSASARMFIIVIGGSSVRLVSAARPSRRFADDYREAACSLWCYLGALLASGVVTVGLQHHPGREPMRSNNTITRAHIELSRVVSKIGHMSKDIARDWPRTRDKKILDDVSGIRQTC
jgi:hypothetical protein